MIGSPLTTTFSTIGSALSETQPENLKPPSQRSRSAETPAAGSIVHVAQL